MYGKLATSFLSAAMLLALSACGSQAPGQATYYTDTQTSAAIQSASVGAGRSSELLSLLLVERQDLLDGLNLSAEQNSRLNRLDETTAPAPPSDAEREAQRTSREAYREALGNAFLEDSFEPPASTAQPPAVDRNQTLATVILAFYNLLDADQRAQFGRNLRLADPAALTPRLIQPQSERVEMLSNAMSLNLTQKNRLETILISEASQISSDQTTSRQQLMDLLAGVMSQSEPDLSTIQTSLQNRQLAAQTSPTSVRNLTLKQIHDLLNSEQREIYVELNGWVPVPDTATAATAPIALSAG